MSFLSSFKKAFGFTDEYDTDDEVAEAPTHTTPADHSSSATDDRPSSSVTPFDPTDTTELSGSIFDAVITLFNETQPDFVKQCLSLDAQRAYILKNIDAGVRATIDSHIADARAIGERQAQEQHRRMMSEIDQLKADYNKLQHQRDEFQNAKLSASRQKRAMTERIADLESQVNNLIAEREQYQIENRSMANKLRIATLRIPDTETGELQQLEQIVEDNANLTDCVNRLTRDNSDMQQRIHHLESRLAEAESADKAADEDHQAALEEIEKRIADFEQIKQRKNQRIEELQARLTQSAQLNDRLTTSVESLGRECDELHSEVKRLTEMINASEVPAPESRKPRKSRKRTDEPKPAAPSPEKATQVKISAIDELMDSTDWFTVPEAIPPKKSPEVEEDFGYKEPVRPTPASDSDKQLSLF